LKEKVLERGYRLIGKLTEVTFSNCVDEEPKFIQESMKDEGLGKQGESMSFVQASGHLLRLFWL
jgi:hypothetical protein